MSGGSHSTPHYAYNSEDIDKNQLSQFMQTQEGAQFSSAYDPKLSYARSGDKYAFYDPKVTGGNFNTMLNFDRNGNAVDATPMINAFKAWQAGNTQTQTSWQNYSNAVASDGGGQGESTITSGPAMGQRRQLLGALANAGNPVPTTPTPGLGNFGASIAPGGRKP